MIEQAIKKIDDEAEKKGDSLKIIASHIINEYLNTEKNSNAQQNAEKVLNEKKTLKDCFAKCKDKARQLATNRVAVVSDDTVYGWVSEYYGFAGDCNENEPKIVDLFDFV